MFSLCGPRLDSLFLWDFIVTLKSTKCVFMTNKLLIKRCPNVKICFWCLTKSTSQVNKSPFRFLSRSFFLSFSSRVLRLKTFIAICLYQMRYDAQTWESTLVNKFRKYLEKKLMDFFSLSQTECENICHSANNYKLHSKKKNHAANTNQKAVLKLFYSNRCFK